MTTRRKLATAAYLIGSIAGALYGLVRIISVMGEVPGIRNSPTPRRDFFNFLTPVRKRLAR